MNLQCKKNQHENTMTTRYYYDCPVEATYMNIHYHMIVTAVARKGVRDLNDWCIVNGVDSCKGSTYLEAGIQTVSGRGNTWINVAGCIKFYVHDYSLHILEPQEGDIGISGGVLVNYHNGAWCAYGLELNIINKEVTIIRRNGLHFMYPKKIIE